MSFPAALALFQIGTSFAEGIAGYQSGRAEARAAKTEGRIAMSQAEARAAQTRRAGERVLSSQLAAAGAAGVVPVTGSSAEVMGETLRETEVQAADELYAGEVAKYQAKLRAKHARRAGGLSLLRGLGGASALGVQHRGILGQAFDRVNGGKKSYDFSVLGSSLDIRHAG